MTRAQLSPFPDRWRHGRHRPGRRLSQAQADFQLSERFTDADGDLVADIPDDESQWLDPDTLVFAYTPVEDPAVYADVWAGFLEHMEEVTGKEVQFFPVQSNAARSRRCVPDACT